MKTASALPSELARLAERLEPHRVAMLTVQEPDGTLTSRPMTPLEMDEDGAVWMMTSRRTSSSWLRGASPPVNLAFSKPDEDAFVSISGTAETVDDIDRKEELWSPMARTWFDGPHDPDLVLLCVRPRHADAWEGPGNVATRLFAMTASAIAGHEVGLGHKEEIDLPGHGD